MSWLSVDLLHRGYWRRTVCMSSKDVISLPLEPQRSSCIDVDLVSVPPEVCSILVIAFSASESPLLLACSLACSFASTFISYTRECLHVPEVGESHEVLEGRHLSTRSGITPTALLNKPVVPHLYIVLTYGTCSPPMDADLGPFLM